MIRTLLRWWRDRCALKAISPMTDLAEREDPIRRLREAEELTAIPVVTDQLMRALEHSGRELIAAEARHLERLMGGDF